METHRLNAPEIPTGEAEHFKVKLALVPLIMYGQRCRSAARY
jgi:hypothetical protein